MLSRAIFLYIDLRDLLTEAGIEMIHTRPLAGGWGTKFLLPPPRRRRRSGGGYYADFPRGRTVAN